MKKTFRKITAMATALLTSACLMMPMTMSYTAFAANDGSITITSDVSGHTFEAYQIFDGDLSDDGILSNVEWGTGVNGDALLTAVKAINVNGSKPFSTCTSAADVAAVLSTITAENDPITKAFADAVGKNLNTATGTFAATDSGYEITGLDNGYYLVKDKDGSVNADNHEAYTNYIVKVAGTATVSPKTELPSLTKEVGDINNSDSSTEVFGDSADHDFGDTVNFKLTGTLPANYADYDTYQYDFYDTLSAGLTLNVNTVKVFVDNSGTETEITSSFTIDTDATPFTIKCANLKAIQNVTINANSKIIVKYSATLNENTATVGSTGNPNTAHLVYSNNPNGEGTGKTPDSEVKVYTYAVVINKTDSSSPAQPLNGATFKLEKYDGTAWAEVETIIGTSDSAFTFDGLDDGRYKLSETKAPAGYNPIEPVYFKIEATHNNTGLTGLTGTATNENGTVINDNPPISFTPVLADGTLTADVKNAKGDPLPSTGGIGTTIFYVGGGALVAVAGVFLIAKKRMSSK